MHCAATYRITEMDLLNWLVKNHAVAQGLPPGSRTPVKSRPASARAYGIEPVTG